MIGLSLLRTSEAARRAEAQEYAPDARRHLVVADALCLAAGALLAIALHRTVGIEAQQPLHADSVAMALFALFASLLLLRLGMAGQYDAGSRFSRVDDTYVVLRSGFMAAAITVFVAVLVDGLVQVPALPRGYVALVAGTPIMLVWGLRIVGYYRQTAAFRAGRYLARSLVIGDGPRAREFLHWLEQRPQLGMSGRPSSVDLDLGLREYMDRFTTELAELQPDEVILALEQSRSAVRAAIIRDASLQGIDVRVLPEVFENYVDIPFPRTEGVPVATEYDAPGRRFTRSVKYATDRVLAVLLLLLLSPMLLAISLLIWLEDRGPVIFAQERVGEQGSRFLVRKFRTMHVDAEARRAELQALNEADGPIFKMRDDPRITRVGRVLRRTSFDEFPQLWNVAFGEMSLVGPRPPLPSEVDEYHLKHRRRLLARPGMTGLWQVSGRSETTFDEMVDLDLLYIEHMSFRLDLKILLRTVRVVLGRTGAY
jgi:exopolysaccharide biosynthesis polyprenyl glycosylphosphotransferase